MTRQPLNDRFLRTSFLSGANASYVEDMQSEYERNPGSVSDEWRHFFESLKEDRVRVREDARGPTWARDLPLLESKDTDRELLAALTGDYGATERSVRDSLQAKAHTLGYEMSPAASLRVECDSIRMRRPFFCATLIQGSIRLTAATRRSRSASRRLSIEPALVVFTYLGSRKPSIILSVVK